jgi:apolipoprotein N-acyltransferase
MCGADILVGMFTHNDDGALQNSLVLFNRDGSISEDVYVKRRLVPFGEYVPMRGLFEVLIPPLTEVAMLEDDIARGTDSGLIDWNGTSIGSLICFDSIYESETLESVRDGAELLILCTNDSWFDGTAAMNMHLAQAKMRAVESGRYVVRAANTGISAIIDGQGRTVDALDSMMCDIMVCRVGTTSRMTLYGYVGNMWVYLAMLFVFFMGIGACCKKSQKND